MVRVDTPMGLNPVKAKDVLVINQINEIESVTISLLLGRVPLLCHVYFILKLWVLCGEDTHRWG